MEYITLTEREKLVLKYLIQGLNNKQISDIIHVSVHTTKAHLEAIYEKLRVHNRVQAIVKAIQLGIVSIEEVA